MHLRSQFIAFVIATLVFFPNLTSAQWKVGTAKIIITPKESMWLAGYAARDRPSEGAIHDLWAKAMVLEDNSGNKGVIVTADLIRFHKSLTDEIKKIISSKYGLSESQIILNPSHTHSGPEVNPERIRLSVIQKTSQNK
jgi:neutral ceramidase